MTSISYRHLARQLRRTQLAQQAAQQSCQHAQQQLQEFKARSQAAAAQAAALLQTMSTAILAENHQQVVTLLNQRICDLFGLPEDPGFYIGKSSAQLLENGSVGFLHPQLFQETQRTAARNQERVGGLLFKLNNGTIIQQDYLPVVQNGQTVLHIWSYEDVTERQQAHERVQELSDLAEQSPQPIIRFDATGEARYANPAAAAALTALAMPREALVKRVLSDEISQALKEGKPRTFELRLDGGFYLWSVAPLGLENGANVYLTDITLRRQAEAELVRSQLFTLRINDTVPNIVFLYDTQAGTVLYCNRQCEQILGYTEAELKAMGPSVAKQLLHPEDLRTMLSRQRLLAELDDSQVLSSEYRMLHRNGTWRWMSLKSTCFLRDSKGRVSQAVCSIADITERRITEEQLRQSRLLMDRITNTTPNLIYIFDILRQCTVYCNSYIKNMLGYTEAELKDMGSEVLPNLLPPDQLERLRTHFAAVAQAPDGTVLHLEFYLYHRNGMERWLRIGTTPFERDTKGNVCQVVGSAEDITRWKVADEQRRSANRRLAEQNRLFRQVIDTAPNLIYLKDIAGNYVLANQATAQLYKLTAEELVRTPAQELERIYPDMARYRLDDEQVIRTRQELAHEDTFTSAEGEVHWFNSIKRPFLLADGTVQVLGVDNEITDLKETELALQKAKEIAEENAQSRQNFLTNMSHEIRTPMNGIMGITELLTKTPLNEQQRQYLQHIQHSAENLLVVINDILDMAQLGAGRIRVEAVPFQLDEVLKASCQSLLHTATTKGINLHLQLPAPNVPMRVIGDPYRLRQVLLNLLNNAVKFTERGNVLLTCRRVSNPNGPLLLQFSVLDTGIGISAGQLQAMFEPFAQASASTAREYGGSGLGLSISRGLVELLGGELTAESHLHKGSTFRFTLPFEVATDQEPIQAEEPITNYQMLGRRHILLAEDNAVNQMLVRTMLEGWGLEVDVASSGPEALAKFWRRPYDVVLMDIQMPGLDGVATTRRLREHPDAARAATPVVALTAHAMQGEAERYLQAGLDAYLSKPFKEHDLFRTISGLLSGAVPPRPVPAPEPPAAAPDETAPLYNLTSLRRHTNSDEGFVRRLVNIFIQTTPPTVEQLEIGLANQDRSEIAATAHHLKSSVDGLGVQRLYPILRELEKANSSPETVDFAQLASLVAQVRQTTDEVIKQLREEFPA
ncbi:PAS domain S-box protein [Hymenobacter taeanensis]|uniref:Sensory/regulatory protein RpfC n=1 Tax=Hymenobacter taeanensis TaxID=2735321 RepID=A0A6M6BEE7_9BACT|nr:MULTISPECIES: PAS domain S-box protein [Hymenobacter]QJX46380.1 PAS domain S-box protein [Hymenobacter taeanensis]UOQ80242.1 PAS domain S-box protein [Hymenobacter sp. 5414T-23]